MGLPASDQDEPCGTTDQLGIAIQVDVEVGGAFVTFPAVDGVENWRLQATLYFGPYRVRWDQEIPASSSAPLVAPETALVDGFQASWLSRVELKAFALDATGRTRGEQRLPTVWAVWDAGTDQAPRWLDSSAMRVEAPNGAVSALSLAPTDSTDILEIEPPIGGAL